MDEGLIKFNYHWIKAEPTSFDGWTKLNDWRDKLYDLGLIGSYPDGIGFGNISVRTKKNNFLITGSQTGSIKKLDNQHYTEVTGFGLDKNNLTCRGPIKASSESLSHASVYESSNETNAVIHIHSLNLWQKLIDKLPTTDKSAGYGTPEMVREIQKLFQESNTKEKKVIIMGGHKEGIIIFGDDLDDAGNVLSQLTK